MKFVGCCGRTDADGSPLRPDPTPTTGIMTGCCVPQCSNNSRNGVRMFRFPASPSRRKRWLAQIKRDQWTVTASSYVCSVHFEDSSFEQNRKDNWKKLTRNAVPTLFPFRPVPKRRKPPKRLFQAAAPTNGVATGLTLQDGAASQCGSALSSPCLGVIATECEEGELSENCDSNVTNLPHQNNPRCSPFQDVGPANAMATELAPIDSPVSQCGSAPSSLCLDVMATEDVEGQLLKKNGAKPRCLVVSCSVDSDEDDKPSQRAAAATCSGFQSKSIYCTPVAPAETSVASSLDNRKECSSASFPPFISFSYRAL